ncbi:MAG: ATP synthase F1 subunit gamma [Nitrospina sp.]|nr:ATP synthase F1 subunit gamma [Nitrospina sp.]
MPNLRDIKRRIRSVKNTQQITKAMKLVSASKLRKAQEAMLRARPYALKTKDVMNSLAARCDKDQHPLLNTREVKKVLILLITSDKGLCGGFNSYLIRKTNQLIKENEGNEISFLFAGKKGNTFFQKKGFPVVGDYLGWTKSYTFDMSAEIAKKLTDVFLDEKADKVYIVYNEFKSVIQQTVIAQQLLPVVPGEVKENGQEVDYIYEPGQEGVLEQLLKMYVETLIHQSFLESIASEHGARMAAMDNASRNAKEMIGQLTLFYNKARQAYITTELTEIVSGAESLKG